MIFARRSRSASAWRAIARCMLCGISTSLISTVVTFTPQGSVWSSMIFWRSMLSFSRSDRSESSSAVPSTERSVVCEICVTAERKFSTSVIARFDSITRK